MKKNLCWLRRDLRLKDNHALGRALTEGNETFLCFVFDTRILSSLNDPLDRRLTFIIESLQEIEKQLQDYGSSLIILHGDPVEEIPRLMKDKNLDALYYNRDYEPYAKLRDQKVEKKLHALNIKTYSFKDHVFYEKEEIKNGSGKYYQVFTPYKNKWLETFYNQEKVVPHFNCPSEKLAKHFGDKNVLRHDWWTEIGFIKTKNEIKGGREDGKKKLRQFRKSISHYHETRDFPFLNATSHLSAYIRMGNISIREMINAALETESKGADVWLNEIIWREFYQMILDSHPEVEKHCYRRQYDQLKWEGKKKDFQDWCNGKTGFPIVDAAMKCLNATGFMHNRLRMIVASFLTKTLLIDWKKGERYFAEKLMDYDLASNNGGWQWCASTGVDAQPYFRIFNPVTQSEKFDPEGEFIRKWCPELIYLSNKEIHSPHDIEDYPAPIVSYQEQKVKALKMFKLIE